MAQTTESSSSDPGANTPAAEPAYEWITPTEAAKRVVAKGYRPSMTRQRIRQLGEKDPDFPVPYSQWRTLGTYRLLPWEPVEAYFKTRKALAGTAGHRRGRPVTVIVTPTRREARFRSPEAPELAGVTRWVANNRHSAETDPDENGESVKVEAARRDPAIRRLAEKFGLHVETFTAGE